MRIAILGGSGNAGRAVARLLLRHTNHEILILGRDAGRAEATADTLRPVAGPDRVRSARVPDPSHLPSVLPGQDVLLVAAPVSADVAPWARAALAAGCDWFDLLLSVPGKWAALRALADEPLFASRCLVTDGGVHPGLPGALVRLAARRMPVRDAHVAMRFAVAWGALGFAPETLEEFTDELRHYEPRVYREGRWTRGWRYARAFDFGPGVGRASCAPMFLAELEEVQQTLPGLRNVDFQVAGFGPMVDWVGMPAAAALLKVGARRMASRALSFALRRFGRTDGPSVVLLEARDEDGGRLELRLASDDAYVLTAAPVVATLLQWDTARRPGLHSQAGFVDPERLVGHLPTLGVAVT